MRKSILIICLCLFPLTLYGQYERPGSASGKFLNIGVSPRAEAMGGAYIAIVNNAEAAYYNPAILANYDKLSVVFNHNNWFAGINHDYFAISYKLTRLDGFAFSATTLTTDEMKVRTPLQPNGTGETFRVNNYRFGLSYGRMLTNTVSMGLSANYINLAYYQGFESDIFSADVSVIYLTQFHDFSFGIKISNFGSSVKLVNEEYPLPQTFTFGLGFDFLQSERNKLIFCLAADKQNDSQTLINSGLEWNMRNIFFLRGGYKLNHDIARFSGGFGLRLDFRKFSLNFDYSLSEYGDLGVANRFGMNIEIL